MRLGRLWDGLAVVAAACLLSGVPQARAQLANPGAGAASAPAIDRNRADRVEPDIQPSPAAPRQPAPTVNLSPAAEPAASIRLTRVIYMGASLPAARLDAAVSPLIGRPLTRDTLQAVATAVGAAYARSDIAYYSVSIPAQIPAAGQLIVQLVEGRVVDYRLAGLSPSTPTRLIDAHMQRMMRDQPLRKSVLQRTLSLLRDIPGQTVDAGVRQGAKAGDLIIDLIVKRKQLQVGLLIDNSGVTNVVNGVQAQLSITGNGLLREGDSTRIAGYLPFYPERYQLYSLSHSTPIGSNGTTLSANVAHVETRQRDGLIKGDATLAGISLSHPLIRSNSSNLTITASFDGVDSSNYYLDLRFGDYKARAVRLGASWSHASENDGEAASLVVSRGVNILGAKPFTGFSETGFTKANMQAVAVRGLSKRLSVKLSLKGQYSRDQLPVTERFSLGGRGAGMAFLLGVRTAEQAAAAAAEISWTLPPKVMPVKNAAIFAYADGAVAHSVARPFYGLRAENMSLASVGGGVRVGLGGKWRASAEVALPVKRPDSAHSRKARFFFGLGRAF